MFTKAFQTIVMLGFAAGIGACNSDSTPAAPASAAKPACTFVTAGQTECILYKAAAAQSDIDTSCASVSGATSASCSTTNVLGTCTGSSSPAIQSTKYYNGGTFNGTTAGAACTAAGGTYAAG